MAKAFWNVCDFGGSRFLPRFGRAFVARRANDFGIAARTRSGKRVDARGLYVANDEKAGDGIGPNRRIAGGAWDRLRWVIRSGTGWVPVLTAFRAPPAVLVFGPIPPPAF